MLCRLDKAPTTQPSCLPAHPTPRTSQALICASWMSRLHPSTPRVSPWSSPRVGMLPRPHRAQDAQPDASSAKRPELVSSQGVTPSTGQPRRSWDPQWLQAAVYPQPQVGLCRHPAGWPSHPCSDHPASQDTRPLSTLGPCADTFQNLLSSVSRCGLGFPGLCVAAFSRSGQRAFPRGHTQDWR